MCQAGSVAEPGVLRRASSTPGLKDQDLAAKKVGMCTQGYLWSKTIGLPDLSILGEDSLKNHPGSDRKDFYN